MTTSKGAAPVWRSIGIVEVKAPSRAAVLARRLAPIVVPAVVMALFYLWGRTTMAIVVGALAVVIGGGSALFPPFRRGVERVTGFIGSAIGLIALSVVYVLIFFPIAMVLKLSGNKLAEELHPGRDEASFRSIVDEMFEVRSELPLEGGTRILFELAPR